MAFRDLRSRTDKRQEVAVERPAPSASPKTTTTYIDTGCELCGQLRFQESVTIDGRIDGEIDCAKMVVVGPSAQIRARVAAESVVVHGTVEGDVVARRKITLHRSAHVSGDMRTAGIVIEEGARFQGQITIGSEESAQPAKAAEAQAGKTAGAEPRAAEKASNEGAEKASSKAQRSNGAKRSEPEAPGRAPSAAAS